MKRAYSTKGNSDNGRGDASAHAIQSVINFLSLFVSMTLAKRIVGIILLAAGIPVPRTAELSHICVRSLYSLKKAIVNGKTDTLFSVCEGNGRRSKTSGIEEQIAEEIDKGDYRTQRQIADMIEEKYSVKLSERTVGRLLKKRL